MPGGRSQTLGWTLVPTKCSQHDLKPPSNCLFFYILQTPVSSLSEVEVVLLKKSLHAVQ